MAMVTVVVTGLVPVTLRVTALPEPAKEGVGVSVAPAGDLVTATSRATLPVNPPEGVRVTVEVLAVVAPGLTVMLVAERV